MTKMSRSPTALALELLKDLGYHAGKVETWVQGAKRGFYRDLWGCIDIHAVHKEHGFLYVQVTGDSGGNMSTRVTKISEAPVLPILLHLGAKVEVWGWSRRGPQKGKRTWHMRRVRFKLLDNTIYHEQVGRAIDKDDIKSLVA